MAGCERARADRAASSIVVLLVGLALFGAAFAIMIKLVHQDGAPQKSELQLRSLAENAASLLAGTTGTPSDWQSRNLSRTLADVSTVGLLSADDGFLDPAKIRWFIESAESPLPASRLEAALGMNGTHVRVRIEPVRLPLANGTLADLAPVRIAYVGAYTGSVTSSKSPTAITGAAANEESEITALGARFSPSFASSDANVDGVGSVVPDDQPDVAREIVPRLAGFNATSYTSTLSTTPSTWKVARKGDYGAASWWSATTPSRLVTTGNYQSGRFVNSDRHHLLSLGVFDLRGYSRASYVATLTMRSWLDASLGTGSDVASVHVKCLANCSTAPEQVWSSATSIGLKSSFATTTIFLGEHSGEKFSLWFELDHVSPVGIGSQGEGWFLAYAAMNLTRVGHVPEVLYENRMDFNTTRVDVLVIGSDVDHAAFEASDHVVSSSVRDWVRGGGRLLVLGSSRADSAWLSPEYVTSSGSTSVSGLFTDQSDLSHPLVSTPHHLVVASHDYAPVKWTANSRFMRVLVGKDASGHATDALSVSLRTSRFEGAVVLADARPGLFAEATEAFRTFVDWIGYLAWHDVAGEAGESMRGREGYGQATALGTLPPTEIHAAWPARVSVFVWN